MSKDMIYDDTDSLIFRRGSLTRALGVCALAMTLFVAMVGIANTPVQAGESARFVRLGLNKSMVIRLPAPARDVLIGNPAIVDAVVRTQSVAYLFAKKAGQTNAFFFDAAGRQILAVDIEVAIDMKALQKLIRRTLPKSRIRVDTIGDNVVLAGTAATAAEVKTAAELAAKFTGDEKKVVTTVSITTKDQVTLKVRVAEVQRDVLKQLGVDTNSLFNVGNFTASLITANPFTVSSAVASNLVSSNTYASGADRVNATIRAMERDGLLRTLAEPTLTAISGEAAKFLAGGEFPVPVGQDNGAVSVEFKPFGVGLGFTPVVLSEGRISLRISSEVSELSTDQAITIGNATFQTTIPALKVRRAETTVELPSGGSLVMAGLIQEKTKQDLNGIPGVKNLPVLGALFRSRDFLSNQTEMVAIVTPYIVKPVNEKKLVTPVDKLDVASDRQTILFGRLNKVYGAAGAGPKGSYQGNVGFIVE